MHIVCAARSYAFPLLTAPNNIVRRLGKTRVAHHARTRTSNDLWSNTKDFTAIISGSSKQQVCQGGANLDFMDKLSEAHRTKTEDFRPIIRSVLESDSPLESLLLVDAIQRLGIDYHFQEEIETILRRHDMMITNKNLGNIHDESQTLFEISLRFRLLRQEGHYVPAEIFNSFKDKNKGNFHEGLRRDIRGLMELYEATQLKLEGEYVLDEAADFSTKHLKESLKLLDQSQAKMVQKTLKHPYHKSLSKFMAKSFLINDFRGISRWVKPLQELARMEFTIAQSVHRQELLKILRWWKDLNLLGDLELARDQPVKWYTWTMACVPDISFSELRIDVTKSISFIYIIDDIFDIYGTIPELTLFTEAVNRWDLAEVEQLPDYMKKCFKALYDVTNEIGCKIYRKYGHNPINFLRQTWASLCNAFLEETKWFVSRDLPKADEYLSNAKVSSGVHVFLVHVFFSLGLGATKQNTMRLNDIADLTSSVATILRLWDDLGSAKDEKQDGHDGSYIDYFVRDHSVTVEFAREHVVHMISNEWKQLNKENLHLHKSSSSFTKVALNSARMVPLMYDYDEDQSLPLLEAHIKSVLYDDLPLQLVS